MAIITTGSTPKALSGAGTPRLAGKDRKRAPKKAPAMKVPGMSKKPGKKK